MMLKPVVLASVIMTCFISGAGEPLIDFSAESLPPAELLDTEIIARDAEGITILAGMNEGWPNVTFRQEGGWNLKGSYTIKADFTNLSSARLFAGLKLIGGRIEGRKRPQQAQGMEQFEPGETRTMTIRLATLPWVFSEPLPLVGMRRAPGVELMDAGKIRSIQVFAMRSHGQQRFKVSNIRVEGTVDQRDPEDFLPFVDRYGQFKHKEWANKIHSDEDLLKAREAEEKALATHPGFDNLGTYGGWKDGPRLEATGFFRVEQVDGKWWFVDPEGLLFWSNGPTCMFSEFGYSGVDGREDYFEDLPGEDDPLAQFYAPCTWAPHGFYEGKTPFTIYQQYRANLYRKYGEDWETTYRELAHRRLKSWGMNTVANWGERELFLLRRTPYTAHFFIEGARTLEASSGYWGQFHDVFDPSFRETIKKNMAERTQEANDPWCIGFFVDNELSWGSDGMSLALDTLACPPDQPAKQEFVADLKAKYKTIETLNLIWGTNHASWQDLLESRQAPERERAMVDLKRFYAKTADTYFRTVKEELSKTAPNHMYLGCRFAWVNDTVAHAAALYCDVMSYNQYVFTISNMFMPEFINKPMIIGEYHFGATDRNSFHPGLRDAGSQLGRGEKYEAYVKSALDNPQVVGVHWFQYVDEHLAGRADGENYNVGLVDICDTPYPEMVEAIRRTSAGLYEYRRGRGE